MVKEIGPRIFRNTGAPKDIRTGAPGINCVRTACPDIFSAGQAVLASWRQAVIYFNPPLTHQQTTRPQAHSTADDRALVVSSAGTGW